MAATALPRNTKAWLQHVKNLSTIDPFDIPHTSGSHATFQTALSYRIIWLVEEGDQQNAHSDFQQAFIEHHLLADLPRQDQVHKILQPILTKLLSCIQKSGENFPTEKDINTIEKQDPLFAAFLENLQQVDNASPKQSQLEVGISDEIFIIDRLVSLSITPFTPEPPERAQRREVVFNSKRKDKTSWDTPSKTSRLVLADSSIPDIFYSDSDNEDGAADSKDQDITVAQSAEYDPSQTKKHPHQRGGGYSLNPPNTSTPTPKFRKSLDYLRKQLLPPHRTGISETNITHTVIPLLQRITHLVLVPPTSFLSSSHSTQNPLLVKYKIIISPSNHKFTFYGGSDKLKLWEARIDGAVLMQTALKGDDKSTSRDAINALQISKPTSKIADEKSPPKVVKGIIEAKNTKRTDIVRYQEGAEIVAYIRERSKNRTTEPRMTYVFGFCGSYAYITIATWGEAYEDYLQDVSEGKQTARQNQQTTTPKKNLSGDLFDRDEFLSCIEYGPFPLDCAGSLEKLLLNSMLLMGYFPQKFEELGKFLSPKTT